MSHTGPILLVDSNLISYASSNKNIQLADAVNSHFATLDKTYELSISGISRYELFQHSTTDTAKRVKAYTDFLRTFDISSSVLNVAAVLSTCYKQHPVIKCRCDSISMADKVIGATAMLEKDCYILTSDFNDFPRPFFSEHNSVTLTYQGSRKHVEVYILKPDVAAYTRHFKLCYPQEG